MPRPMAVRENKTIAQTGSQQRTMVSCNEGMKRILGGELGEIKEVHTANLPSPWENDLGEEPVPSLREFVSLTVRDPTPDAAAGHPR